MLGSSYAEIYVQKMKGFKMNQTEKTQVQSIIYLGFVAPSEIAEKGQNSSISGNNAELGLLQNVLAKIANQNDIHIISYQYNIYRNAIYRGAREPTFQICENELHLQNCKALNFDKFGKISKLVAIAEIAFHLLKTAQRIIKHGKKPILLIVNTSVIFSIPAILVSKLYGLTLTTYLIDGYYQLDNKSRVERWYARISRSLLKHYNYVVALCQNLIIDYCTERQKSVSITPVAINAFVETEYTFHNGVRILFAGGVAPQNGILEYIDAMQYLENHFFLDIYGVGELVTEVLENEKRDTRISYCGIRPNSEIRILETEAHILLIVRSDKVILNKQIRRYGIPYKILEYLQSGTPIIASEMESIPTEFHSFINFCEPNGKAIAQTIRNVINDYAVYKAKALSARNYMAENCTWEKCRSKICDAFGW